MPCSSETTSQNLAPIWLPHWPPWIATISRMTSRCSAQREIDAWFVSTRVQAAVLRENARARSEWLGTRAGEIQAGRSWGMVVPVRPRDVRQARTPRVARRPRRGAGGGGAQDSKTHLGTTDERSSAKGAQRCCARERNDGADITSETASAAVGLSVGPCFRRRGRPREGCRPSNSTRHSRRRLSLIATISSFRS